jgi:hypothetical protein
MKLLLLIALAVPAFAQYGVARSVIAGAGAPAAGDCMIQSNVGRVWARTDASAASGTLYICANTGSGYAWSLVSDSGSVSSVFGRTGAIIALSGDYTTALVTEAVNLYFTEARARAAISAAAPLDFTAGVMGIGSTFRITTKDATAPVKTGTSVPGTCTVGDLFFDTDAVAGENMFGCTATNTWTLQSGGAGGAVTDVTAGGTGALTVSPTTGNVIVDINTAYVPSKTGTNAFTGSNTFTTIGSATNCSDSAGAAACGSAMSGSVVIDAAATTVVVSTTAVTANSQIHVTFDESLGTRLGVTCNTTFAAPWVSARTAGASFTIKVGSGPVTNRACFSYTVVN